LPIGCQEITFDVCLYYTTVLYFIVLLIVTLLEQKLSFIIHTHARTQGSTNVG